MKKILIIAALAFTSISFAESDSGVEIASDSAVESSAKEKIGKIRTHLNSRPGKYDSLQRMTSKYDLITNEQKANMLSVGAVVKECLAKDKSQRESVVFLDEGDFCKELRARRIAKAEEILARLEETKEERKERLSDITGDDDLHEIDAD